MKFECISEYLIITVEQVAKARSKSSTAAYLQDVYISLDDHQLTLRATNLEMTCEKSISVKGIHNGSVLIKGDILVKTVQAFKNKKTPLTCEVIEGVFVIASGNDVIEIKTTPQEDFPTLPHTGEELVTLPQDTFSTLIREVMFCAATTEIKPEIASVYLYNDKEVLTAVATDSYRLAEKKIHTENIPTVNLLIPQKYITDILSILESEEGDLTLSYQTGILTFTKNNLTLSVHSLTGQFPDYRQLFPKECTTTVVLSKEELTKALTVTSLFTENYSPLSCQIDGTTLTLQTKSESLGKATQTLEVTLTGEPISVYYNNRYFLDVIPHIEGNQMKMEFTTPNRPVVITSMNNTSFTYLLMPVNR